MSCYPCTQSNNFIYASFIVHMPWSLEKKFVSFYFWKCFLIDKLCYQILIDLTLNYLFFYLDFNFPIFFGPQFSKFIGLTSGLQISDRQKFPLPYSEIYCFVSRKSWNVAWQMVHNLMAF